MDEKLNILDSEKNIEKRLECCGNDNKWDKVYLEYVLLTHLIDTDGRLTRPSSIDYILNPLLIKFGMGRQIKTKLRENFTKNLKKAFDDLQNDFRKLKGMELENFKNVNSDVKNSIKNIYLRLSNYKKNQKNDALINGQEFCVGATKIMNFIFPHFLIMIDRKVRRAMKNKYEEELRDIEEKSAEEYIKIMEILSTEITNFGPKKLEDISIRVFDITIPENKLPVPRIMDKILFMIGDKLEKS